MVEQFKVRFPLTKESLGIKQLFKLCKKYFYVKYNMQKYSIYCNFTIQNKYGVSKMSVQPASTHAFWKSVYTFL